MKYLTLNNLKKRKDYIEIDFECGKLVFTNAEQGRSFNRNTPEGVKELEMLRDEFNADEIKYLRQVHSSDVFCYNNQKDFNENDGDGIVTDKKNTIIGVFTADCVPVLLIDETKKVISAVHSGWRGTFNDISYNAVMKMQKKYGCQPENIKAYIGPHIKQCCYEISEELKKDFIEKKKDIPESKLFKGRNLSMEACINDSLIKAGLNESNIFSIDICTHCEQNLKLYSYRKSSGTYGRMFAFGILK